MSRLPRLPSSDPRFSGQPADDSCLSDTASKLIDAALAFYKALKVYPTPADLINIYDKTVSKV